MQKYLTSFTGVCSIIMIVGAMIFGEFMVSLLFGALVSTIFNEGVVWAIPLILVMGGMVMVIRSPLDGIWNELEKAGEEVIAPEKQQKQADLKDAAVALGGALFMIPLGCAALVYGYLEITEVESQFGSLAGHVIFFLVCVASFIVKKVGLG